MYRNLPCQNEFDKWDAPTGEASVAGSPAPRAALTLPESVGTLSCSAAGGERSRPRGVRPDSVAGDTVVYRFRCTVEPRRRIERVTPTIHEESPP